MVVMSSSYFCNVFALLRSLLANLTWCKKPINVNWPTGSLTYLFLETLIAKIILEFEVSNSEPTENDTSSLQIVL